ncbi:hypothetical protein [Streptomyces sp. NPDC018352]|uniref:hypothetical protein n=1 Tax=Streptomyces sp. NPDC018352 TaxID=3157194 RepID=UPI0033D78B54
MRRRATSHDGERETPPGAWGLPEDFPPWRTCCGFMARWADAAEEILLRRWVVRSLARITHARL